MKTILPFQPGNGLASVRGDGLRGILPGALLALLCSVSVQAQEQAREEQGPAVMEVIGITPIQGAELPETQLPFHTERVSADDLEVGHGLDITDYLNRRLPGVNIQENQGNRYQPNIQFRGFTLSPLLGLPQGLSVYQDGVRVNEVFGDTLNWDLIPEEAIASLDLVSGANPLFGLNTLGGVISLTTKNGFDYPGHGVELQGGSHSQLTTQVESAMHGDLWAYYGHLNYLDEDSWRDLTSSGLKNYFGKLSFRDPEGRTDIHLSLSYADTELTGNGPAPAELLRESRQAIFTAPDITDNELRYANLQFSHYASDFAQFSGTGYYRETRTDSFNGDSTEYEACPAPDAALLCEEDEDDPLEDQNGDSLDAALDALNNLSEREQSAFGGTLQGSLFFDGNLLDNHLTVGGSYQHGDAKFRSWVEAARLADDRTTVGTGLYIPGEGVGLETTNRTWSAYFSNTLTPFSWLHVTLSGRYNSTRLTLDDTGGNHPLTTARPDLNGMHDYQRFNPAIGFSIEANPRVSIYGSYSESARAPSPVELACASPEAPCLLPNSFLSDPPLEQVVAKGFDAGVRGRQGNDLRWRLSAFRFINKQDIIFQATGGTSSNRGFFSNVGDTRRLGLEAGLEYALRPLDLNLNLSYSFVEATFETTFPSFSPHHPNAGPDGRILVGKGNRIPSIPRHTGKAGLDWHPHEQLLLGLDYIFNSDQLLRGDESNQLEPIGSYGVLNFYGEVRSPRTLALDLRFHVRVDNVLSKNYESFGLLGDPAPRGIDRFSGYSDPRFLSPGAPRAVFAGISLSF